MNKILNTQATYTVSVDQAVTFGAEKAVLTATEHYNIRAKKKHKMTHRRTISCCYAILVLQRGIFQIHIMGYNTCVRYAG